MAFLNHGSFGAVPRVVLAAQDEWRRRVERQPVRFLVRELEPALRAAAGALGTFLGVAGEDLVFVDNVTMAANTVLRSLRMGPGDEVVFTSHGYGAVNKAVRFACDWCGATAVEARVPFPIDGDDAVVEAVAEVLTERTRLVVVDHVTSATALVLPVARIASACRARGVPVFVDGAHGPGMLDVDIAALGVDYYTGNCHKWLFAAKGTGFLWVAPQRQAAVHPLVVSWGYGESFTKAFDWPGTKDFSPWLALTAALQFYQRMGGAALRTRNNALAAEAATMLEEAWGVAPAAPRTMNAAMVTIALPIAGEVSKALGDRVHDTLADDYGVEVPIIWFAERLWLRISVQAYNERGDYERLREVGAAGIEGLRD
ncbi:MAG: aminotransferase class V-fold PLP-dependent enzyme [Phycisphaerales bacterium]|nr:aminotransferase class V-fold PLP-dependent enzyme [Phycisphaerales bacterium]